MTSSSQTHFPSLFGSLLFLLAATFFLSTALVMGVAALAALLSGETVQLNLTIFFLVLGFEGVLLLIATFVSIQKFLNKPTAEKNTIFSLSAVQIILCVIVTGIALILGSQISSIDSVNWIILPFLTIPAVALPLWLLLGLATQKLSFGTRWQTWNIFGLGMTLGPLILIILETVVLLIGFIMLIFYIVTQPDLVRELERLSNEMVILGPDSEEVLKLFAPYLTQPGILIGALAFFALIVPALEEIFKPIGVWLFARRLESQAQGFALGALSGAAFALAETFGVSGQSTEWGTLLFTRIGTGILHITTTALMGSAIVLAWREHRYWQGVGTYILVVALHGIWNALALTFTFSDLMELLDQSGPLRMLQLPISISLGILALGMLAFLILYNRKMRDVQAAMQGLDNTAENEESVHNLPPLDS